jgi:hypothetical protein
MKNKSATLSTRCGLCIVLLFLGFTDTSAQHNRLDKVRQLYDSIKAYHIESPETVLATVIVETGWLECKDCSLGMNNLFGFRSTNNYVVFANTSQCLVYMKKWQEAFYGPWKAKHPAGSYYDFLCYVKYAADMPRYVRNVKSLERWVWANLNTPKPENDELVVLQNTN